MAFSIVTRFVGFALLPCILCSSRIVFSAEVTPTLEMILEWQPPAAPPFELAELAKRCTEYLRNPGSDAVKGEVLYRRCRIRWELGDLDGGHSDIEAAVKLIPDNLDCRFTDGRRKAWSGQVDAAKLDATDMIRRFPGEHHGHALLAECHFVAHDFEMAVRHFDRAILAAPESAESRLRRATALFNLGRHDDAQEESSRVLQLPPTFESYQASAFSLRGDICFQRGQYADAISNIERCRQIRSRLGRTPPETPRLYYLLWSSYSHCKKIALASTIAEQFNGAFPDDDPSVSLQALSKAEQGDVDVALTLARRAVGMDIKRPFEHSALARIHLARGEWREAMSVFEKVMKVPGEYGTDALVRMAYIRCFCPDSNIWDISAAQRQLETSRLNGVGVDGLALLIEAAIAAERGGFKRALELVDQYERDTVKNTEQLVITAIRKSFEAEKPYRLPDVLPEQRLFLPISILLVDRRQSKEAAK